MAQSSAGSHEKLCASRFCLSRFFRASAGYRMRRLQLGMIPAPHFRELALVPSAPMFCSLTLPKLPIGAKLASPIYDERRTKLIAAGIEITEHLLHTLTRRNIASVVVGE